MITVYLLIGLALAGSLYWALTQITVRQRRLNAELTRLERLTAEVSMNAEALLERVDERTERLCGLLAMVEARAGAAVPAAQAAPVEQPAPAAQAAPKKRGRPKKQAPPAEVSVPGQAPEASAAAPPPEAPAPAEPLAPASIQRYQELRSAVWSLADQGKQPAEIAQELGVPRGEVQLLINLRSKKVTA